MRKKAVTPRAKMIAKMDDLWRKKVKERAGKCEWCGEPGRDCHHMVGRRRSTFLRHRLENGVYLCVSCHMNFHNKESLSGWKVFEYQRKDDYDFLLEHMHKTVQVRDWDAVRSHLE